jgi:hypothetical protein
MSIIVAYDNLVNLIQSYSERTDEAFVNRIPDFITLAQLAIAKDAKTLILEMYIQGNFIAGESVYQKPYGWRNTLEINYGSSDDYNTINILKLKSYEVCRQIWPNPTLTSEPLYYADFGFNNILIVPTPDKAYPFEWCYQALPDPIGPTNQTNYLTDFAPELLFYACMVEVQIYLKNFDERLQSWQGRYQEALSKFIAEDKDRITDRYAQRDKG